jgi:hypothetical protein
MILLLFHFAELTLREEKIQRLLRDTEKKIEKNKNNHGSKVNFSSIREFLSYLKTDHIETIWTIKRRKSFKRRIREERLRN